MSVAIKPCEWPISYSQCGNCEPLTSLPASGIAQYEDMATEYLWNWTGQKFGLCETTLRPCRKDCDQYRSTFWGTGQHWYRGPLAQPVLLDGLWYNFMCGYCGGDSCSCKQVSSLKLPGPVDSVTEVKIDGVAVDPSKYRVDNHVYLVRTDGEDWPRCQDLSKPAGEEGTWTVTYKRGINVPVGGQVAAGVLACEFAKAACNDGTCQLPKRLASMTRQGVTLAVLDTFDDIDKGHTGIWVIDSWVASVTKAPRHGRVFSPDLRRPRRTTSP